MSQEAVRVTDIAGPEGGRVVSNPEAETIHPYAAEQLRAGVVKKAEKEAEGEKPTDVELLVGAGKISESYAGFKIGQKVLIPNPDLPTGSDRLRQSAEFPAEKEGTIVAFTVEAGKPVALVDVSRYQRVVVPVANLLMGDTRNITPEVRAFRIQNDVLRKFQKLYGTIFNDDDSFLKAMRSMLADIMAYNAEFQGGQSRILQKDQPCQQVAVNYLGHPAIIKLGYSKSKGQSLILFSDDPDLNQLLRAETGLYNEFYPPVNEAVEKLKIHLTRFANLTFSSLGELADEPRWENLLDTLSHHSRIYSAQRKEQQPEVTNPAESMQSVFSIEMTISEVSDEPITVELLASDTTNRVLLRAPGQGAKLDKFNVWLLEQQAKTS